MSPGVNDGPRNTGTLPKSNRRNDRNRARSAANQIGKHSAYYSNLYHLQTTVDEREPPKAAKNSNTESVSSVPSTSYQDISELASNSSGGPFNYTTEEFINWQKMVLPTDPRTESPRRVQGPKPSNVDKMPDQRQVESRLMQIREYIGVTSTMMDSLSLSSDPRAQTQNEKLGIMVEDLRDSERKLTKLLEEYQNRGILDENSENGEYMDGDRRESRLRKKMEESQAKLAQLQERQAALVGMQLRVREKISVARQAQQALLQQEDQSAPTLPQPLAANVEQLESEADILRGKLAQLQDKKKHMDHLVAELQAVEMSDRGSCSSEGSRNYGRDKAAELEAMKAQLAHLKALMEETMRVREDSTSDMEPEPGMNGDGPGDVGINDVESETHISYERQCDSDETGDGKMRSSGGRSTIEEMQAMTRELREQSSLLQNTRAELQRLKQQPALAGFLSNSASAYSTTTPSPLLTPSVYPEKKQSNNASTETQPVQDKRRQLEDLMRKESTPSSSINRDMVGPELNSHRSSSSQVSHTSTPANIWPPPNFIGGSNEQSVEGVSSSDQLLDIGAQTAAIENGLNGNWWACPPPPLTQLQHGSTEYYRQLLLGSQAQQLQMMGTTIQQCFQLLWSQQRELQSMRSAINNLQMQLRQNQGPQRINDETSEEYSNLSRTAHHLGETMDGSLPPSSSLPNLVTLPNTSPALSHSTVGTATNSQQHQQQQLNNQVPPGNRANNYWDNFRSYSRQNLLSGNVKTMADTGTGTVANSVSLANAAASGVNSSLVKDKRNKEQESENLSLPTLSASEAQYSSNLQLQSNLQQQERENTATRSNILTNEMSQQQVDNFWDEAHSSYRFPSTINDGNSPQTLSVKIRDGISALISANKTRPDFLVMILRELKTISEDHRLRPRLLRFLRTLQDMQSPSNPLIETTELTASESCQSSDEDSEAGVASGVAMENRSTTELIPSPQVGASFSPTAQVSLIDHVEIPGGLVIDFTNYPPSTSFIKPGCNEDLAEADQSRPDSSGNQRNPIDENESEQGQDEAAGYAVSAQTTCEDMDLEWDGDSAVDKMSTGLHHL